MSIPRVFERFATFTALFSIMACQPSAATELTTDGTFDGCQTGSLLRKDEKGPDWYESRKDGKEGRALLKLSTKDIGGNATHKAMIKGDPELNTYLTQRVSAPQKDDFFVEFDIFVRGILTDDNRSAFFFVGTSTDGKNGPNSSGVERFVFIGFENAAGKGKINLFAREGSKGWDERTIVARDLDLGAWHSITVRIQPKKERYVVSVKGKEEPRQLESFRTKGKTPRELTHLSFASWDDGAGTFYVDNVRAYTK
jgi:hypothetical protein